MSAADDTRRAELAENLARVRARIDAARSAAGRTDDVTLVAVTKTYPAGDVALLADLGVTDIGENKDQEAAPKAAEVGRRVRWHFVGQLQRNKARSVSAYADVVHSVDSVRLAAALDRGAQGHERVLDVLVQVSLDGDPERGGALPDSADPDRGLAGVAGAVAGADALRLAGLMAVAPLGAEPDAAFARLAEIAAAFHVDHPTATVLSAGMSDDLENAIRHGATHVRIGSALLGKRHYLG
ncbi:YggS family pyridoxal phosphate-dependent enzyme [Asanoa sp. WMMD1127]|uniref:YggS family pyridoxal phosphate-dependent enzyme n=1 Tax=Asanoa sp. WMMD1127 TaxID=3016107 RepID=UPI002416AC0E|nr:YggS family pyridoxal phosphate-dependent enzyme [Asanoa sp. WMMD1127]MDG4827070.1 YggS family pyridoxal phosphate-dependent enzyme [Asanoa sp. WMMD1127]